MTGVDCSIKKNTMVQDEEKGFGETLRDARLNAGLGLREMARLIDKSPGYLSDVENGRVPPPSEAVIVRMAAALMLDKTVLLNAAQKVDPELSDYMAQEPRAADFMRLARERGFDDEDWERLKDLARIAKLGKTEEEAK